MDPGAIGIVAEMDPVTKRVKTLIPADRTVAWALIGILIERTIAAGLAQPKPLVEPL